MKESIYNYNLYDMFGLVTISTQKPYCPIMMCIFLSVSVSVTRHKVVKVARVARLVSIYLTR